MTHVRNWVIGVVVAVIVILSGIAVSLSGTWSSQEDSAKVASSGATQLTASSTVTQATAQVVTSTADLQEAAAANAIVESFLDFARARNTVADTVGAYASSTPETQQRLMNAIVVLNRLKLAPQVADPFPIPGGKILTVSALPDEFQCGYFGSPLCAFLLQTDVGKVVPLRIVYGGERIQTLLPEGLLLRDVEGDGGGGSDSYALLDLKTGERREIISDNGSTECGWVVDVNGNGLKLNVAYNTIDDCHVKSVTFTESSGNKINVSGSSIPDFAFIDLDATSTLRNPNELFFMIDTPTSSARFVYDGRQSPPKLSQVK